MVYIAQGKLANGSPTTLESKNENVLVDEAETFSNQYYSSNQRQMRTSRNLIVPTFMTYDKAVNGTSYELMYVDYDSKRYKVKNILKVKGTRMKMLLDIQEVR